MAVTRGSYTWAETVSGNSDGYSLHGLHTLFGADDIRARQATLEGSQQFGDDRDWGPLH